MSDLLIKGMEVPSCCAECWFRGKPILVIAEVPNRYKYISKCSLSPETEEDPWHDLLWSSENKEDWCPLVEIPAHGRLIDADEAKSLFNQTYCQKFYFYPNNIINITPTVIPASE